MLIVVIGSKGFLGSNIIETLSKKDNFIFFEIFRKDGQEIDFKFFSNELANADVIIYCAENANRSQTNLAGEQYKIQLINNLKYVLSLINGNFIYLSSSLLYETDNDDKINIYSKLIANDLYTEIKRHNEIQVLNYGGVVLRLSNVYGPKMNHKTIFHNVISNLQKNKKMNLNNWTTTRDFIYVSDVCNLIYSIINNFQPGVFNVGTSIGTSIYDIAISIAYKLDFDPIVIIKGKIDDKSFSKIVLDISETIKCFNWQPKININQGITLLLREIDEA